MTPDIQTPAIGRDWSLATEEELVRGYQEMAADEEREEEAREWCEALIGDGFEAR
jgi:hypothetical protein